MNIVFMGTPEFSVSALEELIKAGHNILAVVTQPDKARGRGKEIQYTPVKEAALKYDIPVYQPKQVKDTEFVNVLREINPDVMVVIAFGQILSKDILDIPKYGCINIHASLLPKYRGAAPIQWSIIDGEEITGVTTMYMNEGLDTGDMLDKEIVKISKKETGGSLHDKLAQVGSTLIIETLDKIEKGNISRVKQEDSESTYAKILDKKLGNIDFSMKAVEIERLIRGLNPWPSAYTKLNNKNLKIWDAEVIEKEYEGNFGEIVDINDDSLIVKTGENSLAIMSLQLEGKKRMDVVDFLRGYKLEIGQRLG